MEIHASGLCYTDVHLTRGLFALPFPRVLTGEDGKIQEAYSKLGEVRWFPAVRHAVENLGVAPFSGVYIGIKGGMSAGYPSRREAPHLDEQTAKFLAVYLAGATASGAQPSAAVPFARQR